MHMHIKNTSSSHCIVLNHYYCCIYIFILISIIYNNIIITLPPPLPLPHLHGMDIKWGYWSTIKRYKSGSDKSFLWWLKETLRWTLNSCMTGIKHFLIYKNRFTVFIFHTNPLNVKTYLNVKAPHKEIRGKFCCIVLLHYQADRGWGESANQGRAGRLFNTLSWNKHSLESIEQGRKIDVKTWS